MTMGACVGLLGQATVVSTRQYGARAKVAVEKGERNDTHKHRSRAWFGRGQGWRLGCSASFGPLDCCGEATGRAR